MFLELMYITNNPQIALIAESAGVDRIWIDLEKIGKSERQPGDTVKSNHSIEDIAKIRKVIKKSSLQVRINPINKNSDKEIENVILSGADIIMLPYFKSVEEVKVFLKLINGRVKTNLLIETRESVELLDNILKLEGIDEIHIGLNDLHISYNNNFMFELLTNGIVERIGKKALKCNIPFGFGGISKIGDGLLPSEYIIEEHYRLGSTKAILSRGFIDNFLFYTDNKEFERKFIINIKLIREHEERVQNYNNDILLKNKQKIDKIVNEIVEERKLYNENR